MIDPSAIAFLWRAGDARGTFTRATVGSYIDQDGVLQSAASGAQRGDHWLGGIRTSLFEHSRAQVAANPQAPNSWTNDGAPSVTTGHTDPFGGTSAIHINGDGKLTPCTFTGNGTKCLAVLLRQDGASTITIGLHDATAGTYRHALTLTWAGGASAPTLVTASGTGTIFGTQWTVDEDGVRWALVTFAAAGVLAANTNNLRVLTTGGGSFYLAGGNAWDAAYPTSWQATAATRNADQLVHTVPAPLPPLSIYAHFIESEATPFVAYGGGFAGQLVTVGGSNAHWLRLDKTATTTTYRLIHQYGAGNYVDATIALNPDRDDRVELLGLLYADGSVNISGRVNGGAITTGTRSSALVTPLHFVDSDLHIGGIDGDGVSAVGLAGVVLARGTLALDDAALAVCQPYVTFTDDVGAAVLYANVPTLGNVAPDVVKIGDGVEALANGARYFFEFRRDYLAEVTVAPLGPNQLVTALRLKEHLLEGGTCTLMTGDKDYAVYTCRLAPGTDPVVALTDRQTLDYEFRAVLKNTADAALTVRYR